MEAIPFNEIILGVVIIAQLITSILSKRSSEIKESQLIQAILARNLPEYTASLETPTDKIKHMGAESKLAKEATKLEREMSKSDIDTFPKGAYPVR